MQVNETSNADVEVYETFASANGLSVPVPTGVTATPGKTTQTESGD